MVLLEDTYIILLNHSFPHAICIEAYAEEKNVPAVQGRFGIALHPNQKLLTTSAMCSADRPNCLSSGQAGPE